MIRRWLRAILRAFGYLLYFSLGVYVARAAWLLGGPPAMALTLIVLGSLPFYWRYILEWLKSKR